jgi:hypothetical protein
LPRADRRPANTRPVRTTKGFRLFVSSTFRDFGQEPAKSVSFRKRWCSRQHRDAGEHHLHMAAEQAFTAAAPMLGMYKRASGRCRR